MKVYVLAENTPYAPEFAAEHGLSLYVETKKHRLLFDTGQSGVFAENAEKLGVDLGGVDTAFISHGHYDHGGGLKRFFELNGSAPVYAGRGAFGEHYNSGGRYIGLDRGLRGNSRIISAPDELVIDEELSLRSCNGRARAWPSESAGMTEREDGCSRPDRFLHEQYLTIKEDGRDVLFSGCSHKGILNIMEWLRPDVLIGGFHFMNLDVSSGENEVLDRSVALLDGYGTEYYTGHCTGAAQYEYLKKLMGGRLHSLSSGQVLEI